MDLQGSPTYAEFGRQVYGRHLFQQSLLDEEQLQQLICDLNLTPEHRILDLGCGLGYICEYISDQTGAHVLGVDTASELIESAQTRTAKKIDRLQFLTADFNSLPKSFDPFDAIISIDTLYFIEDLAAGVRKFKKILKPQGKFAAFYSYKRKELNVTEPMDPHRNKLAIALMASQLDFQIRNYSANEKTIWEKTLLWTECLKESFKLESRIALCEGLRLEAEQALSFIDDKRSARGFYLSRFKSK